MSQKLQKLLRQKPYLHWWVKDKKHLSDEAAVFAILNYGEFADVQVLIQELSLPTVRKIFEKHLQQKRNNYHKKTKHFFSLYFKKHAFGNSR